MSPKQARLSHTGTWVPIPQAGCTQARSGLLVAPPLSCSLSPRLVGALASGRTALAWHWLMPVWFCRSGRHHPLGPDARARAQDRTFAPNPQDMNRPRGVNPQDRRQ